MELDNLSEVSNLAAQLSKLNSKILNLTNFQGKGDGELSFLIHHVIEVKPSAKTSTNLLAAIIRGLKEERNVCIQQLIDLGVKP